MTDKPHLIIDLGSECIKAGFSGEDAPRAVFPCVVGRPKAEGIMVGSEHKDYYVGSQAEEKRGILRLTYPIEHGLVSNWDDLEKVLDHCFTNELRVVAQEHYAMVTEPPLNPKLNREKLVQILFETFNVPGVYLATPPALSIYAAGKFTGVVVDCGHSVTQVVPIFDGYALSGSVLRSNIGGKDVTDYLQMLLSERGLHLTTSAEREIVKNMKETHGYVALDFAQEYAASKSGMTRRVSYQMPDGNVTSLDSERFRAPEVLFQPNLIGREFSGIPQQVYSAIMKSDSELRALLFQNVVLAGGSSLFPGLPERLTKELQRLAPPKIANQVKVIAFPERKYAAWIGGSILSSISTFPRMWITREEYDDTGASIVHSKCL